ncbi:MAG TPA: hypothetical protein VKP69_05010 [Isosphaeraceae bacterium]|nr:hypothetical protein [Isosphaeraceae bacterium]
MAWFHPYRTWLDAGLTIGGGSDPMIPHDAIEVTNPWDALARALGRRDPTDRG